MHAMENGLRRVTLLIILLITASLLVAAAGAVFKAPMLAYFWYLALAGMGLMFLMTLVLMVIWFIGRLNRRYHQMLLHWGAGVPGH